MDNFRDCGCDSARERLDSLIDRELSDQECTDVRAHCATCVECQEELALLERLTDRFREACADGPPPGLKEHILNSLNTPPRGETLDV
jgi:anti-sigma factor (TIGR02949 family)